MIDPIRIRYESGISEFKRHLVHSKVVPRQVSRLVTLTPSTPGFPAGADQPPRAERRLALNVMSI